MRARPARCATSSRVRSAMGASPWGWEGPGVRSGWSPTPERRGGWTNPPVPTARSPPVVLEVVGGYGLGALRRPLAVRKGLDLFGDPRAVVGRRSSAAASSATSSSASATSGRQRLAAPRRGVPAALARLGPEGPPEGARRARLQTPGGAAPPLDVRLLDAGGIAVFAVNGALVALDADAGPLAATLIGGITAIGGGLLRDVLARRVPEVLQRELYAVPALEGAGPSSCSTGRSADIAHRGSPWRSSSDPARSNRPGPQRPPGHPRGSDSLAFRRQPHRRVSSWKRSGASASTLVTRSAASSPRCARGRDSRSAARATWTTCPRPWIRTDDPGLTRARVEGGSARSRVSSAAGTSKSPGGG